MAYRSVDEDFWRSPHLLGLPFEVKAVYNYLITQGGTSGFVYRSEGEHIALLELSAKGWQRALEALVLKDRILLDKPNRLVWVRNQLKWQYRAYNKVSENHDKGLRNELAGLPATPLFAKFVETYRDRLEKDFPQTMAYLNPLLNPLPNPLETLIPTPTPTLSQDHKDKDIYITTKTKTKTNTAGGKHPAHSLNAPPKETEPEAMGPALAKQMKAKADA